ERVDLVAGGPGERELVDVAWQLDLLSRDGVPDCDNGRDLLRSVIDGEDVDTIRSRICDLVRTVPQHAHEVGPRRWGRKPSGRMEIESGIGRDGRREGKGVSSRPPDFEVERPRRLHEDIVVAAGRRAERELVHVAFTIDAFAH